ncbi:MAG: MATE family efflux transporter [Andreesenia angusta]|nr:MATE family efflux transporter [Andreesenia angusta]
MTGILIKKLFNDKEYFRKLIFIALPIVVQNLITSSLNIMDTIMVGRLGEISIASVGVGNQIFLFFNILSMGISSGCGVFISQYWGKGDVKNIRKVFGIAIIGVILLSLPFMIVIQLAPEFVIGIFNKEIGVLEQGSKYIEIVSISYIFTALTFAISTGSRCLERTRPPMVVSVLALLVNGSLNYILIFGKLGFEEMGVAGAAIGTLIARIFEFLLLFIYIFKTNKYLFGSFKDMIDSSWEFTKRVLILVRDVVLNELFWGLAAVIYSIIYGHIGSSALAAIQIYNMVQTFFLILIFGLATASSVMVGKELGMCDFKKTKEYGYYSLILGTIIGVLMSILVFITAPYIVKVFNITETVRNDAKLILYIAALIFTLRSVNIVLIVGTLRGGGDAKFGMRTEAITMWLIGLPLALIGAFVLKLPVYGVVALTFAEEAIKCGICVKRLMSEKWMNRVTE